jgi:hypothetical protein
MERTGRSRTLGDATGWHSSKQQQDHVQLRCPAAVANTPWMLFRLPPDTLGCAPCWQTSTMVFTSLVEGGGSQGKGVGVGVYGI